MDLIKQMEEKSKTGILVLDYDFDSVGEIRSKYECDDDVFSEYVKLSDAKQIISQITTEIDKAIDSFQEQLKAEIANDWEVELKRARHKRDDGYIQHCLMMICHKNDLDGFIKVLTNLKSQEIINENKHSI